jgi:hypothetical protein
LPETAITSNYAEENAMEKSRRRVLLFACAALSMLVSFNYVIGADSAEQDRERITVNQLKEMLGRPDVVIVDVRDPISWDKSDQKIQGAVREDPENLAAWTSKYPKDKTIIFYCS